MGMSENTSNLLQGNKERQSGYQLHTRTGQLTQIKNAEIKENSTKSYSEMALLNITNTELTTDKSTFENYNTPTPFSK